ncbi:DUF1064 domain-containing protein [Metaclostridioides mangenotii]|uniref:DUF1064 domain-containing protein n=1 Tax=Metaclostridioides mangenotii TaxID=1540 RepID=A0ABS4E9T5_9FIRM|nr:DUF1064 domain-containing protein [Clostridioides mangenotii]MBP1854668.1 hypothetical protein [Clostridioides mangenotii]
MKRDSEIMKMKTKKTQSKYRSKKVVVDNIKFDSKFEAEYYTDLKRKKEKGEIKDFGLQYKFELQPSFKKDGKTKRSITYIADFAIYHNDGQVEYIDTKGFSSDVAKIKRKMFDYRYPDSKLTWISKSFKYGGKNGLIEYDELQKKIREAKKVKEVI